MSLCYLSLGINHRVILREWVCYLYDETTTISPSSLQLLYCFPYLYYWASGRQSFSGRKYLSHIVLIQLVKVWWWQSWSSRYCLNYYEEHKLLAILLSVKSFASAGRREEGEPKVVENDMFIMASKTVDIKWRSFRA